MTAFVLVFVGMLAVAVVAALIRVKVGPSTPRAATRPVDPGGGYATPQQLHAHLSQDAARRAGAQVRPSLPVQHTGKGRARGSH